MLAKTQENSNGKVFNLSDFRTQKKNKTSQTAKQQVFVFGRSDLQKKFSAITNKIEEIKELTRKSES